MPLFGKKDADVPGYGVGQVDLAEGPRIQAILLGGPDDESRFLKAQMDLWGPVVQENNIKGE